MRDIQMILERWGAWEASQKDNIGYGSVAAGFGRLLPSTSKSRPACCDGDGLIVSSASGCLRKKDQYLYKLLVAHYVVAVPVRTMGYKLGISHTQVLKQLQAAEGFMDGCLSALSVRLEMDRYCQIERPLNKQQKKVVEFQKAG